MPEYWIRSEDHFHVDLSMYIPKRRCSIVLVQRKISIVFLLLLVLWFFPAAGLAAQGEVVIYTALDQPYSEPILEHFEKQTGIEVKAVYDVEATKTIGLVNRIIAEKSNPQCDVFWNNEIVNTIRLKNKGLLEPYASPQAEELPAQYKDQDNTWYGFAARTRVIVYNTELLADQVLPASIHDFLYPRWKGKTCLAVPLFGTTASHMTALFQKWGTERTMAFLQDLQTNGVDFVDGNSVVRDKVADGTYLWGFTDTDDAYSGMQRGLPIDMIFPDQSGMGTLAIPNTVCLIKDSPNPDQAKALIDFLLSEKTEKLLAQSGSAQIPVRPGLQPVKPIPPLDEINQMEVDFNALAPLMEKVLPKLENFL